ncbi:oligosaccharide flippase family protein [Chloroflexota bacterium]
MGRDMDNAVYKKFTRDISISASADVVLRLKGFILMPILTKAFGTVNYGIWAQVGVMVGLLAVLAVMGIDGAVTRFLPGKSREEVREGFYTYILFQLAICILFCLALVFSSQFMAESFFDSVENARFVILAGAYLISTQLANGLRRYFRIFTQMKTFNALIIYASLANAVAGAAVALLGYTIFELIIIHILIDLTVILFAAALIIKQIGITFPRFKFLKSYLTFGIPLLPAGLSNWAIHLSDRLFISYFIGMSALGIYSVVYSLSEMFMFLFFNPIFLMLTPVISKLWNEDKKEDVKRVTKYSLKYALMFAIPAAFGFCILGRSFLTKFTTAEFATGYYLIPMVASGYIFYLVSGMAGQVFLLVQKTKFSGIILSSACVLNIILNALLIPRWGITGAAIATTVTFFTEMLATIIVSSRYFRIDYSAAFILKSVVASSIMGLAVWWVNPVSIAKIFIGAFIGVVVYFLILLALRGFTRAEAEFFIDFIPSTRLKRRLLSVVGRRDKSLE